jgi:hypothetical protein
MNRKLIWIVIVGALPFILHYLISYSDLGELGSYLVFIFILILCHILMNKWPANDGIN